MGCGESSGADTAVQPMQPVSLPATDAAVQPVSLPATDAAVQPVSLPATDAAVQPNPGVAPQGPETSLASDPFVNKHFTDLVELAGEKIVGFNASSEIEGKCGDCSVFGKSIHLINGATATKKVALVGSIIVLENHSPLNAEGGPAVVTTAQWVVCLPGPTSYVRMVGPNSGIEKLVVLGANTNIICENQLEACVGTLYCGKGVTVTQHGPIKMVENRKEVSEMELLKTAMAFMEREMPKKKK